MKRSRWACIASSERFRLIARRSPSASPELNPAERHRDLDHLLLEDDRPEGVGEDRLERGVLVGDLVAGVLAEPLTALEVGMDGAALDRPGADDRHLDGQVVDVLGPGARQHLHLGAALDLEDTGRLGGADPPVDLGSSSGIRERSIRSPRTRAISVTARSTAESIPRPSRSIFRKPASAHESLSHCAICRPSMAAGHDRAEVGQRPRREHHPAGMLGGMTRQPVGVVEQLPQRLPPATSAARPRPRS